jgi:ABC-type branched-subunit amino acid transport system substrate-binding protein
VEVNIMKRYLILVSAILILGTLSCTGPWGRQAEVSGDSVEVDPEMLEVLRKINSVSAYEVPDLGLREDEIYAKTTEDVEPFGHVNPYKEHFLLQVEYTGPGRAIPEPTDVNTVKIGFIGPIMSTVSVATGGKSHEEVLGIKMLQGTRLAIEEANVRGGYLKRNIPFELVISNDNWL